jgi:hypothetical protein
MAAAYLLHRLRRHELVGEEHPALGERDDIEERHQRGVEDACRRSRSRECLVWRISRQPHVAQQHGLRGLQIARALRRSWPRHIQ